jgi:hypothetical protein
LGAGGTVKLDRYSVKILKKGEQEIECAVKLTKADSVSFLWDLTREIYSLSGHFDVESRLQRHVVRINKKAG